MLWREFWWRKKNERQVEDISEKEEEESEEENENNNLSSRLFKVKEQKTNLPKGHSPRATLKDCLAGVKTAILGSPLNKGQRNLPPEVEAAGKDLVQLQKGGSLKME